MERGPTKSFFLIESQFTLDQTDLKLRIFLDEFECPRLPSSARTGCSQSLSVRMASEMALQGSAQTCPGQHGLLNQFVVQVHS